MNKSRYVFFILACLFGLYVQAQNRTVKGRVLSAEDKEPLIGATVKIPGTSIGVVTDIDGNFSLEVPDKDKTLVIEFLGMSNPWDQIYKMVATKSNVLVYSTRINAYIIPREQLGEQYKDLAKIANEKLPKHRVKMQ